MYKKAGDKVNIETDMIGRHLEALSKSADKSRITAENIKKWGF